MTAAWKWVVPIQWKTAGKVAGSGIMMWFTTFRATSPILIPITKAATARCFLAAPRGSPVFTRHRWRITSTFLPWLSRILNCSTSRFSLVVIRRCTNRLPRQKKLLFHTSIIFSRLNLQRWILPHREKISMLIWGMVSMPTGFTSAAGVMPIIPTSIQANILSE